MSQQLSNHPIAAKQEGQVAAGIQGGAKQTQRHTDLRDTCLVLSTRSMTDRTNGFVAMASRVRVFANSAYSLFVRVRACVYTGRLAQAPSHRASNAHGACR